MVGVGRGLLQLRNVDQHLRIAGADTVAIGKLGSVDTLAIEEDAGLTLQVLDECLLGLAHDMEVPVAHQRAAKREVAGRIAADDKRESTHGNLLAGVGADKHDQTDVKIHQCPPCRALQYGPLLSLV